MENGEKKPKKGKRLQRVLAFVLAVAICLTQGTWGNMTAKAESAADEFTLYYYAQSVTALYLNIWNHTGITFADGTTTSSDWGWTNAQGVFEEVEDSKNWYKITISIVDASANDGFTIYADGSSTVLAEYDNNWNHTGDYAVLVGGSSAVYAIKDATVYNSIQEAAGEEVSDSAVSGELNITKVQDLSEDFIMGMDISSVLSEFKSGVVYKDFEGNTIDNVTDFCKFLASCGITHIRVRVWNDPYDEDGNGYGGGDNDVAAAKTIADACIEAGLRMLVDFHCSDFWTDPSKQQAPKTWKNYTLEQKAAALTDFIYASLMEIDPEKKTVDMVQVGNETTSGFIGETGTENMCTLFSAGSAGVRKYNENAKVVIHVTNPEKNTVTTWAKNLYTYNVDYDILATSYYPYWHGTLDNLKSQFQTVKETYGKDVMVAETSYAYTLDDSDGHTNTVRVGNNDSGSDTTEPFTEQGQATAVRNLINAVNEAGGLGVFYWEPAWITVGDTTGLTGDAYDEQVAANKNAWETYGSGWASSYADEYDPTDAGVWYGGSAVDNEAMFYADGTPTAALHVWEYVKTGATTSNIFVDEIDPEGTLSQTIRVGDTYELPATVTVTYAGENVEETVTWDADDIAEVDVTKKGVYTVSGIVALSKTCTLGAYKDKTSANVTYQLTVNPANLITEEDAEFDSGANFTISGSGISAIPAWDDPYSGTHSMHWYSASAATGTVTYSNPISLEAGSYTFEAVAQGMAGDQVTLQICDEDGTVLAEGTPAVTNGWKNWQTPSISFTLKKARTIQLQISVEMQDGGWGTADCLYLYESAAAEDGIVIGEDDPEDSKEQTPPSSTDTTVTVPEDASTGSQAAGTVAGAAENTSVTITVRGNKTKATLSASMAAQVKEAAGQEDAALTVKVVDASGKTKYTIKASTADLTAGNKLYIYKLNTKTGKYTLVNNRTYTVTEAGNVTVSLEKKATYVLVNEKEAKAINKKILATAKAKKSSTTVQAGKKTSFAFSTKLDKANIKSITYTSSKKSVATVSSTGKVTAKKKGTAVIKAKLTLVNGMTKTVTMKVNVK